MEFFVQTAESSMNEINNMILRMRELGVQMANGVYSSKDRDNAQMEVNALLQEIDLIASTSKFNGVNLLDGTYNKEIRAGNTNAEVINISINNIAYLIDGKNGVCNRHCYSSCCSDTSTGAGSCG